MWDNTNKQWWLNDKFKSIETVIEIAKKAVAEANKALGGSNEANEFIQKLEDVKDAVKAAPISPETDVTKDDLVKKIEGFINELADEVDSVTLTGKIKEYFEKIFVITHNPLVNNWADNVIKIRKDENISYVSQ